MLQLLLRHQVVHIMAFVHCDSAECGKAELGLFGVPPTQTEIESTQWIEHRPITTLNDSSPIEFVIRPLQINYLVLVSCPKFLGLDNRDFILFYFLFYLK